MNKPLLASGIIIILMGMIAWLQQNPIDIGAIKGYLSRLNNWFNTGDPEIVYPVALITGLLVATAASWVMM